MIIALVVLLALMLFLNAALHILQGFKYGFNRTTIPVVVWGIILAMLGGLLLKPPIADWVPWAIVAFCSLGAMGLLIQNRTSSVAKWINQSILFLDALIVLTVLYLQFV